MFVAIDWTNNENWKVKQKQRVFKLTNGDVYAAVKDYMK